MKYLYEYLILINIISFIIFAVDKIRAKKNQWRIPEASLIFLAFIGGSLGGLLSMNIFRHKTSKLKFQIGMPVLLIFNVLVIYYFFY